MPTAAAPTKTSPEIAPFRLFGLQVVGARRISPSLMRVTFGGEELKDFYAGGRDQSITLFLPHPGQHEPVLPASYEPATWYAEYRSVPEDVRAVMRSYTVRAQRRHPREEIDIDFVLHEAASDAASVGPACRWAAQAAPGDRVAVIGPTVAENTAVRFQPREGTDSVLIWADETALPAAAAILESLPTGTTARVWLEVQHTKDRQALTTAADARITWLVRDEGAPQALDAVREAELPGARPYVWIAGESGSVKELRRHLVRERELDRRDITFVGYWRRGLSEEQLREEAAA
ncbi:siderophore-interacting protein [Streptomyces sp. NBC_01465]|uniref:siderophore-interacting protein n=1 Tax=Streptomyces sp. NBC_01465 TaxID=2903878 RepID=UPI002E35D023|nr:siderophore-interacting protein [Streptomyces sp. NBC_01465]